MTFATAMPFARRCARSVRVFRTFPSILRRFYRGHLAVVAALIAVAPAAAQEHPEDEEPTQPAQAATLTLEEAIGLARSSNPEFRQTANEESVEHWRVREAYSQFLPGWNVSNTFGYTAEGTQPVFGGSSEFDITTPSTYTSRYSIGFNWSLSGATLFRAAQAKANSKATVAQIGAAESTLASNVTAQYLAALRARDDVEIRESALESAEQSLNLARARLEVGDATRLDVTRAEVDHGRAEVELIRAENLLETTILELMQQIGVTIDSEVELTSTFEVFDPTWSLDELVATALESHPQVLAMQASESAANASSRAAKMAYLPSIQINGGWSGLIRRAGNDEFSLTALEQNFAGRRASCAEQNALNARLTEPMPGFEFRDCDAIQPTAEDRAGALAPNKRFPFDYDTNPFSLNLTVSLPIWNQFGREVQLQTARVAAENAKHQRRAEELNRRTQVATNVLGLKAAYRMVAIEERNVEAADEQLLLSRESYRLGAGTILELTDAQEQKVMADQAYLAAIYTFHETLAALESAVGRRLR